MDVVDFNKTLTELRIEFDKIKHEKASKKKVKDFMNNNLDEIDEFIRLEATERIERLETMGSERKLLLVEASKLVVTKAELLSELMLKLVWQLPGVKKNNPFENTDLFFITVDMINN